MQDDLLKTGPWVQALESSRWRRATTLATLTLSALSAIPTTHLSDLDLKLYLRRPHNDCQSCPDCAGARLATITPLEGIERYQLQTRLRSIYKLLGHALIP